MHVTCLDCTTDGESPSNPRKSIVSEKVHRLYPPQRQCHQRRQRSRVLASSLATVTTTAYGYGDAGILIARMRLPLNKYRSPYCLLVVGILWHLRYCTDSKVYYGIHNSWNVEYFWPTFFSDSMFIYVLLISVVVTGAYQSEALVSQRHLTPTVGNTQKLRYLTPDVTTIRESACSRSMHVCLFILCIRCMYPLIIYGLTEHVKSTRLVSVCAVWYNDGARGVGDIPTQCW